MKASNIAWVVGAVARQPIYAGLVGLGAATQFAVAVGTIAPARLWAEDRPKGGWVSALVGLAKAAKEVAGGFNPVKASEQCAGFDRKEVLAMAGCGLALLADRWGRKLGSALDAMDATSSRGVERKAWRQERARRFQVGSDSVVETVLDAPHVVLGKIKGKITSMRAAREPSAPSVSEAPRGP